MATWNRLEPDSPFRHEVYLDVCTVPQWQGSTMSAIDLDLDVARTFDGMVELLDEDEFAEHASAMSYPDEVIATATRAANRLLILLEQAAPPFDPSTGTAWLDRLDGLAG